MPATTRVGEATAINYGEFEVDSTSVPRDQGITPNSLWANRSKADFGLTLPSPQTFTFVQSPLIPCPGRQRILIVQVPSTLTNAGAVSLQLVTARAVTPAANIAYTSATIPAQTGSDSDFILIGAAVAPAAWATGVPVGSYAFSAATLPELDKPWPYIGVRISAAAAFGAAAPFNVAFVFSTF